MRWLVRGDNGICGGVVREEGRQPVQREGRWGGGMRSRAIKDEATRHDLTDDVESEEEDETELHIVLDGWLPSKPISET